MIRARPLSRTHARLGVAAGAAIAARDAVADTSYRSPPRRANCTGGKPEPRQGGTPPRPRIGAMVEQFPIWLKYIVQGFLFKVFVKGFTSCFAEQGICYVPGFAEQGIVVCSMFAGFRL